MACNRSGNGPGLGSGCGGRGSLPAEVPAPGGCCSLSAADSVAEAAHHDPNALTEAEAGRAVGMIEVALDGGRVGEAAAADLPATVVGASEAVVVAASEAAAAVAATAKAPGEQHVTDVPDGYSDDGIECESEEDDH